MSNSTQWHKHKDGEWHRKRYSHEEEKRILMARKTESDNFRKNANLGVPFKI